MSDAERVIRQHAGRVRKQIIAELIRNYDDIVELAVERATGIGVAEYGDASFHKTPEHLRQERFEEYADAVFYACVERHVQR